MNEGDLPSSVCRGVGLHLQEHGRLHGVRPDKRAIVRGDQHDANSNGRREDSHGDGRRRPIVDVDHRNRRQHADRLHDETHPLDWIHLRLTDQDPLAAGFERVLERGDDRPLRGRLSLTLHRQGESDLRRLRQ